MVIIHLKGGYFFVRISLAIILFYVCCDELQDITLVEALQRIFSLIEWFLQEKLQLAESEIRKLIDYLISNLPSFFKERLAVCCCES